MIKKEYMKPAMQVVCVQQSQMICVSLTSVQSTGLNSDDDLQLDDTGGDQSYAW